MRIQISERCPCGAHLTLSDELPAAALPHRYSVHCADCYDGTEDAGEKARCLGYGATREGAFAAWWEQAGELWSIDEMDWRHSTLDELERQVLAELDAQRGWKMRPGWLRSSAETWFGPELMSYLQTSQALDNPRKP